MAVHSEPSEKPEKLVDKLPLALALIAGMLVAWWLTQNRDGWAEHIAWFALSMCAGGLYGLFGRPFNR